MEHTENPLRDYLERKKPDPAVRNELRQWLMDTTSADTGVLDDDPFERELYAFWESSLGSNKYSSRRLEVFFSRFKQKITGRRSRSSTLRSVFSQCAAILLLPLLIAVYYLSTREAAPHVSWVEVYVPYGEIRHLTLPDGSTAILNSGTHMFYPDPFIHDRQIFVSGEVLLDVVNDPVAPFLVDARGVNIQVLGTRFNVRAYTDDRYIETSLLEGVISLGFRNDPKAGRILLGAGDRIFVDDDNRTVIERFDVSMYTGWEEGYYSFNNKTLGEIAKDFERIFDVQIVIHDPRLRGEMYFASLGRGWTLEQILEGMNMNDRLRIESNDGIIEIWPAGK